MILVKIQIFDNVWDNYGLDLSVMKIIEFIISFFKNEIWLFYEPLQSD